MPNKKDNKTGKGMTKEDIRTIDFGQIEQGNNIDYVDDGVAFHTTYGNCTYPTRL